MHQLNSSSDSRLAPDWLAATAAEIGFDLCGVISAADLAPPDHLAEWLDNGFAGEMRYLHDPRRAEPAALLPEARTAIVCAVNYNPAAPYSTEAAASAALDDEPRAWISRYAWADDYHLVLGEKLEQLVAALRREFGARFGAQLGEAQLEEQSFVARAYVDTGPISERMAARLAGLGWLGKNTCLIHSGLGSWLFLGVILTSLDLAPSAASPSEAPPALAPDLCGNCRLCLDACPTGALVEPYRLDARRCISYLTIELRGSIPEEFRPAIGWQVFGCDICQDVCPWNRQALAATLPGLAPRPKLAARPKIDAADGADHRAVPSSGGRSFSSDIIPGRPDIKADEPDFKSDQTDGASAPEECAYGAEPARPAPAPRPKKDTPPAAVGGGKKDRPRLEAPELLWLLSLSEEDFREAFRRSAIRRAKWRGLVRNACVAAGNALRQAHGDARHRAALKARLAQLAASSDALLAEHARWALAQESAAGPLPAPRRAATLRGEPVLPPPAVPPDLPPVVPGD